MYVRVCVLISVRCMVLVVNIYVFFVFPSVYGCSICVYVFLCLHVCILACLFVCEFVRARAFESILYPCKCTCVCTLYILLHMYIHAHTSLAISPVIDGAGATAHVITDITMCHERYTTMILCKAL